MEEQPILNKYTSSNLFVVEGRYYRLSRLSAVDYFSTTELLDEISRQGTPSAAFLSNMVNFAPSFAEVGNLQTRTLVGPPDAEGKPTTQYVQLDEDELQLEVENYIDQKRNSFMMLLSPLLGVSHVKEKVIAWLSDHTLYVPDPDKPKDNNTRVNATDWADPDIMSLDAIPKIAYALYRHPDIRSFFREAQDLVKMAQAKA